MVRPSPSLFSRILAVSCPTTRRVARIKSWHRSAHQRNAHSFAGFQGRRHTDAVSDPGAALHGRAGRSRHAAVRHGGAHGRAGREERDRHRACHRNDPDRGDPSVSVLASAGVVDHAGIEVVDGSWPVWRSRRALNHHLCATMPGTMTSVKVDPLTQRAVQIACCANARSVPRRAQHQPGGELGALNGAASALARRM